jgi:hypothetical protein
MKKQYRERLLFKKYDPQKTEYRRKFLGAN